MLLKVYNNETNQIETIDSKDIDIKKHLHRNTREVLEWFKEEVKSKPLNKLNKTELMEKVIILWIEWVTEDTTNKEIIELIEKASK